MSKYTETTMALPSQEELMRRGVLNSAHAGLLSIMKECAERLDHGEGLVKTYSKYRDPEGLTALHYGAGGGRTQICKYLIEVVGLDVNMQDSTGETVLKHAVIGHHHQTVAYLIRKGANVNLPNHEGYTALHTAAQEGETVLKHAVIGHHHQTVAYLIRKGANVNLPNHEGYTALHTAAQEGLKETLQLLISNGADIEALSYAGTPLRCATAHGKREIVKILLDNNANPNAGNKKIVTPLMGSILAQSHECTNLLLKAGADPDLAGDGMTPLELAACMGDAVAIKCLLKAGANPNITNLEGMTPLEVSALIYDFDGVMILLPKTSPVPSIPDWTLGGIIKAVHSEEARNQWEQKRKDCFMESKTKGAEAFKKKDYLEAMYCYCRAITCDPLEATMLSNRSLCWARMNNGTRALYDAEACIALKPEWAKAHYRKGVACEMLKDFGGAEEAYAFALKLEPGNKEIQTAFRKFEAFEHLREVVEGEFGFRAVDSVVF